MTTCRVMTLFLLLLALPVQAARVINSVELDGAATTVVSPGSSITVTITVTTSGSGSNDNWDSTSYTLDGVTTCVNTSDFSSDGTYTQVFTITAPATDGSYTISFYAHRNAGCSPTSDSNNYSITDGIEVTTGGGSGGCPVLFPDAVSSNDAGGSISFASFASVSNSPDNILETTNIVDNIFSTSCSTTDCSASGSVVGTVSNGAFPAGSDISVGGFGSQTVPPGDYGSITAGSFSTLTLTAGDYTLSGDLNIAHLAISGLGTVRIWVNGEVNINGFSNVNNPGGADQLVIFANGDVSTGTFSTVNAVIYSNSNVVVGSGTAVTGAVTGNSVNLESWSNVSFDSAAIGSTDFGALCSATPIAEYHFDELAWNGTAGEVVDSTGNGLNGRAVNGATTSDTTPDPARTGNPGTCRYADLNGGTQYVEVADNNQLDLGTALTVTAWIYPRSFPSSDLKTILSKDTNYEFHVTPGRQINWWWNSAGGATQQFTTTGSQLNPDTWYHVAIVYTNGAQRIYINGVERGAATFAGNLITNNISLLIGTDTGFVGSRNFNGAIDEVKIFNSALSASEIQAIYAETHPCLAAAVDHYAISVAETALTCEPIEVTITGHDSSHSETAPGPGTTIALSTSTGQGRWSNASDGALIDSGNGDASYTFGASASITLDFNHPVAGPVNFNINSGSSPNESSGSEDVTTTFFDTGFRLVDAANNPIGTQISARSSDQLYLQAVRTNPENMACVNVFAPGTLANIDMAVECINPSTCIAGTDLNIVYTDSGGSASETLPAQDDSVSPAYTTLSSILFATDSRTPIVLNYPEAGQIQLHSRYEVLDGDGNGTGEFITGNSQFVVAPVGFCVDAQGDPSCTGPAYENCGSYIAAGANFNLYIAAKAWEVDGDSDLCSGNNTTRNFASSNISLTLPTIYPSGGAGDIAVDSTTPLTITNGPSGGEVMVITAISEVGVFTIQAEDSDYLIPSLEVTGTDVDVGRFIPNHFALTFGSVMPSHTVGANFTYFGEAFLASYILEARSATNNLTTNYTGSFAKLNPASHDNLSNGGADILYGAVDTVTPQTYNSSVITSDPGASWSSGTLSVVDSQLIISKPGTLVGPVTDVDIGLYVEDEDDVTFLPSGQPLGLDLDTTTGGSSHDAVKIDDLDGSLFYGRVFIPPVYGPEINANEETLIPFEIQIYNGSSFERNTLDDSTTYSDWTLAPTYCYDPEGSDNLVCADTSIDLTAATSVLEGRNRLGAPINVIRPGPNKEGVLNLEIEVDTWLQYNWGWDWDNDGTTDDDVNPAFPVHFGTYRGHDRIIYWRELH